MAPKNLTQNHVAEDQSDEPEEEVAVPWMKPKSSTPQKLVPSESVEGGSACSSPSTSGFIIAPSQKPLEEKEKKKKKASASKVFSDEDIIAMLKGLSVFWANGRNNKWADFHLFIKDDLRNQFTKTQVSEKIRTLKKKFDSNSGRERANGGRLDLSDPHESAVFELSKALWGEGEKKGQVAVNGDEDEEANEIRGERKNDKGSKITKRRKQGNGEVSKNLMKKRKQLGEHGEEDEKMRMPENGIKELSEEGYEGDERDAANTILSICKSVDEHVDGNTELVKEGIQVEEQDESNKRKQVDECDEGKKKKKKKRKGKQVDEHQDEKEELSKEGKGVDESEEQVVITKEENKIDGHGKKKHLVKKRKQVGDHSEENNIPAKKKQKMEITPEYFQSAFPLLYASFDIFRFPKIAKESCVLIGLENALELEEKWRELNAEMHHIELKKLYLMKKNSKDGPQTK